jgi:hypothetical protein
MAGTTNSSGLNNLLTSTDQTQTTLPTWYDTAQQNVVNQAGSALGGAPSFGQTTAQGAVNTLQNANNPFTFAGNNLQQISSGATNPWNVDANTGAVTPNTNTALGGLFAAQTNQLNQTLPTLTAGSQARAIGSGNFGSQQGQTAVDMAKGNALANLQSQQMAAALQNQQTGTQASTALGNVGAQGITAGLTTGAAQMNAPFQNAVNYSNLVNSIKAPTTVSNQNQMSPFQMIQQLSTVPTAAGTLLNNLGIGTGPGSVLGNLGTKISGGLSSLLGGDTGSGSTVTPTGPVTGGNYNDGTSIVNPNNPFTFNTPTNTSPDLSTIPTGTVTGGNFNDGSSIMNPNNPFSFPSSTD